MALMEDCAVVALLSSYPPSPTKSLKSKEYLERKSEGADPHHSGSPSNPDLDAAHHTSGCNVFDDSGESTSIYEGKGRSIKKMWGKRHMTRAASPISRNFTDCSGHTKAANVAGVLLPTKRRRINLTEEEYTEHTRLRADSKSTNVNTLEEDSAQSIRCFGSCKLDQKPVLCNICQSWIAINPKANKAAKQTRIVDRDLHNQNRKRQAAGSRSMANVNFGSGTVVARRDVCVHVTSFGGENHFPNGIQGPQAIENAVNIDPRVCNQFLNACRNGDIHLVSELLDHIKAEDINYKDISDGNSTALHLATRACCSETVKTLLHRPFIDVNARSDDGYTALIIASFDGSTRIAELLLSKPGINVNVQTVDGWTALLAASQEGYTEIVELLLAHGRINSNARDKRGRTALMLASDKGHSKIVKLLLRHARVDVNAQDNDGWSALLIASTFGQATVVEVLLKHAPDVEVNLPDADDRTPLMAASSRGHAEIARLLLTHKAIDVNHKQKDGRTALMFALDENQEKITEMLRRRGAIESWWHRLLYCLNYYYRQCIQLLQQNYEYMF